MEHSPYLKSNLEAMVETKSPGGMWLAGQNVDLSLVDEKLFVNRFGQLDWRLPEGDGIFEVAPPKAFYQEWDPGDKPAVSASVVVGVNLGYGLNYILETTPNSHKVIVIEPDPMILTACLGQTDYSPFLKAGKLHFLPPNRDFIYDKLRRADIQFLFGQIFLRSDVPSRRLSGEYAFWTRVCRECLENIAVELTTMRLKQDVMVGNELHNFDRSLQDGSVTNLRNAAKGMTGIILGAGPSLNEIGPQLVENPGNVLYATALQTLPSLQRIGLKPHVCMAIDFSEGMKTVFDRLDKEWAKDIPLLYSTKIDPEVLQAYPGPTLPVWTMGGMATFIMKGREFILEAGGNVSVALFRFLKFLGVERIGLVGQDFAWKADQTHADGHHFSAKGRHIDPKRLVELKNKAGETLHSTLSYTTALRDMEKDIRAGGVEVFNLYAGGAVVEGAQIVAVQEAHEQGLMTGSTSPEEFFQSMEKARTPLPKPFFEKKGPEWTSSLRSAQKRLEKLFKKVDKNQTEIRETIGNTHIFLRQDPLYLPYLYNEIMDTAGLVHGVPKFTPKHLGDYKKIIKRVFIKVRMIDELLGTETGNGVAKPLPRTDPGRIRRLKLRHTESGIVAA